METPLASKDYRQMVDIQAGLHGPFGKFLLSYLKAEATTILVDAAKIIPENLREMNEREQAFGKANALSELVDNLPTIINDALKEAQQKEKTES